MSNIPPKNKKKKEELEREQQIKETLKLELVREDKLYSLKYANTEKGKTIRFANEDMIETLLSAPTFENIKTMFFIKLYEASVIPQITEKAFSLLVNIAFKLLNRDKSIPCSHMSSKEMVINYIASHILKDISIKTNDIDVTNSEQLDSYIEANFQSIKTLESKLQSGFYKDLFTDMDNDELKLFKTENENQYDFTGLNKVHAYNWLHDYMKSFECHEQGKEILNEALMAIDILFLRLRHAFQYYLNYPPNTFVIKEMKIIDEPLVFEEKTVESKFPLRSIENCLFKMKNDPINPSLFDDLNVDKIEESIDEGEPQDEWEGLDSEDIENIKKQLDDYKEQKEVELNAAIEENNAKKNKRRRK